MCACVMVSSFVIVGVGVPEGCHHKAVVQCRGQRAGPVQARGGLPASNISEKRTTH
jgi:hypothetical protein